MCFLDISIPYAIPLSMENIIKTVHLSPSWLDCDPEELYLKFKYYRYIFITWGEDRTYVSFGDDMRYAVMLNEEDKIDQLLFLIQLYN